MSQTGEGGGRAVENPYSLEKGFSRAEPLNEGERKVQDQGGGGGSMCINLTQKGADHHGIEIGQYAIIETYEEGILIRPVNNRDAR